MADDLNQATQDLMLKSVPKSRSLSSGGNAEELESEAKESHSNLSSSFDRRSNFSFGTKRDGTVLGKNFMQSKM